MAEGFTVYGSSEYVLALNASIFFGRLMVSGVSFKGF